MKINGRITTVHRNAACVAAALAPDNLDSLTTVADGDRVTTVMTGTRMRTIIASADDYLMNLAVADDACSASGTDGESGRYGSRDGRAGQNREESTLR